MFLTAIVACSGAPAKNNNGELQRTNYNPTIENNETTSKPTGAEGKVQMIDIEPSQFALSDEEYDSNFDYGDEDSMLVYGKKKTST